ncbi:signal recognition particle receptor subunit beta [Pyxicephalus adspersus]
MRTAAYEVVTAMAAVQDAGSPQWSLDMESIKQELQRQDPTVLSVVVAIVVVLVSLVLWKLLRRSQTSRRAILLVGLSDSGKTLLFIRLLTGKFRKTQTSITAISATYRAKSDKLMIQLFFLLCRAIVFVVDSSAFQREVKDVAEFLYQILTDAALQKNAPSILIACNKQDISMAKSAKLIQQQLEKELNTLRVTQSAAPSTLDSSSSPSTTQLGKKGKDFDFSQLPMKVEFLECSTRDSKEEEGDANLSNVEGWLAKLA